MHINSKNGDTGFSEKVEVDKSDGQLRRYPKIAATFWADDFRVAPYDIAIGVLSSEHLVVSAVAIYNHATVTI